MFGSTIEPTINSTTIERTINFLHPNCDEQSI